MVNSDRRPQEVASMIAEANTVILVCIFTIVLLKFLSYIQYILPILTDFALVFTKNFQLKKKKVMVLS